DSAKAKIVNEDVQIWALVDGKKIIITEASIRRDLQLHDAEGTACLPNAVIFEELARMSAKTTAWNEFSSTMASRKPRKETEVSQDETPTEEHIFTPPHDPLPSEYSEEEEGLGDQEDASKLGRIAEMDADEDLFLINETAQNQGMINDEDLFGVNDLDGDEVIMNVTAGENVEHDATVAEKEVSVAESVKGITAATTLQISKDDVTLAQNLIEIKAAKPMARGVIVHEPSEFKITSSSQPSQLPQAKDKGKGIMVEPKKPLKKKDQIAFDEEVVRKLDA
nr:hypothetical protein [Tanacetum cinerariifolium]